MTEKKDEASISRRRYLKYSAAAVVVVAAGAGGAYYYSTMPPSPPATTTATTAAPTTAATATSAAKTAGFFWGDTPFEMEEDWYWTLNRSALAYANYVGDRMMTIDPHMHPESQITDINYMMKLGIDGLMGCPTDPDGLVKTLEDVKSHGIPIATYDGTAKTKAIDISVRVDSYSLGAQCGDAFAKKIQAAGATLKGTVFSVTHGAENPVQMDRIHGLEDSFSKAFPDLKIQEFYCTSQTDQAKTAVSEAVKSMGTPAAVLASNGTQLIGAVEGLQSAGVAVPTGKDGHVWVAGVDAMPSVLTFLKQGLIDQAIDQPPLWYGSLALKFLRIIKLQGEEALPNIGQTVISDASKPEGQQSDGTYNIVLPDIEYKGVRPFQYPTFAPCPVVDDYGHRWLQVNATLVDATNADTAPIYANVAKVWFG